MARHIEQAGVHSGDSACSLPPYSLSPVLVEEIKRQTVLMAKALMSGDIREVGLAVVPGAAQSKYGSYWTMALGTAR